MGSWRDSWVKKPLCKFTSSLEGKFQASYNHFQGTPGLDRRLIACYKLISDILSQRKTLKYLDP